MEKLSLKKYGKGDAVQFRRIETIQEAIDHCSKSSHVWILSLRGDARQAKVNGKVRTWKRNPSRIEIPMKYGLYEYFTITNRDFTDILIEC